MAVVMKQKRAGAHRRVATNTPLQNNSKNAQLVECWTVFPSMFAGKYLLNSISKNNATLTNMATNSSTSGFGGTSRIGGRGEVRYAGIGVNDYLDTGIGLLDNRTTLTLSLWMYAVTSSATKQGLMGQGGGGNSCFFEIESGSTGRFLFRGSPSQDITVSSGVIIFDAWSLLTIARTTTTVTIYVNGVERQKTTAAGSAITSASSNTFHFGNVPSGTIGSSYFLTSGRTDDMRLYAREFSAPEVWNLYVDSLTGLKQFLHSPSVIITSQASTTVSLTPVRQQWRAQSPVITRALTVSPAQEQWRTQVQALTRSFFVSPAQEQWAASSLLLSRSIGLTPVRMQWQAQAPGVTRSFFLSPAQIQWRAQAETLTRSLALTPTQVQWQAQSSFTGGGSTFTLTPARMQWQTGSLALTRILTLSPSQEQWRVNAALLTQILTITPDRLVWTPQRVLGQGFVTIVPARMQWQAETLGISLPAQELIVSPAQMAWFLPGIGGLPHTIDVSPAQMAWMASVLTITQSLPFAIRANALTLAIETSPVPVTLAIEQMLSALTLGLLR